MAFRVLIPARLGSTRLPRKPLADIAGLPMVVRVARQAARSAAVDVTVAADDDAIVAACRAHGVAAVLTATHHATGSDRLAEACALLGVRDDEVVVNVQGDEPLIEPALVEACARALEADVDAVASTVAHPLRDMADAANPNVVKVVLDARSRALYFSRAPIPWARDRAGVPDPHDPPLRHVGIYAYRAGFLRRYPTLAESPLEAVERLEQLRILWHGERIAVHVTDREPGIGIDTPEDLERVRALFASRGDQDRGDDRDGAGFA